MYGYGKEKLGYIPVEEIMARVSEEEIFAIIFGFEPKEYQRVTSPFREDSDAGCWFEYYNSVLMFIDFGDTKTHRAAIPAVQEYYGITFLETLHLIDTFYELGLAITSMAPLKPEKEVKKVVVKEKLDSKLQFRAKPYYNEDYEYWAKYGITINQLISDGVYSVRWFKVYSEKIKDWVTIRPNKPSYAITGFEDVNSVKIYTPDGGDFKWVSSVHKDDVGNLNNLEVSGETLIITKSYKDYRVIKNQGNFNTIWVQSENQFPNEDIIRNLGNRFNNIKIIFDNDSAGIRGAKLLQDTINSIFPGKAIYYHIPIDIVHKDPSDLYENDKNLFETTLKQWNLYNRIA